MEDDDNQFKIACQCYNGFVTCYDRSGELIYTTFLHSSMYTIGLYPEDLFPENFYFQWPVRTKMKRICQRLLKEGKVIKSNEDVQIFEIKLWDYLLRNSIG